MSDEPKRGSAELVAYCGLYCGACGSLLRGRCPGCHDNEAATWCKIRGCCRERDYTTCADCDEHPDPKTCATYHNWIARIIGFVLRGDRSSCVLRIRQVGAKAFADEMAAAGRQNLPRG